MLLDLEFAAATAGIRPVVTMGVAHKRAGVGQIGAGIVRVPVACFTQALEALAAGLPPVRE